MAGKYYCPFCLYLERETVAVFNTSVQEDAVIGPFIGK
jgi:hypothetical protein